MKEEEKEVQIEGEAVSDEGTDLTTVLRSEADDLPLVVEATKEAVVQQEEVGMPLSENNPLFFEEQTRLLQGINKHLGAISVMVGILVALAAGTFVVLCRLLQTG